MNIALLFPGYSSQFVGMGKELYDEHRIMQEYFEEASSCLDQNFVKLCFASSEAELGKMQHAYTATFLVSCSLYALLQEQGIKPAVLAGFNQGEYAAIFAGNGMSLPDGLYLLNKYASFYEEVLKESKVGAIRIQGVDSTELEAICEKLSTPQEKASIALYETDTQHIVTGDKPVLDQVRDMAVELELEDTVVEPVSVDVGLHSAYMNPVVEQFRMYLEKVDFKDLLVPMIESADGDKIEQDSQVREHIVKRITSPVVWTKVMKSLAPYDCIIQIGPGTQLRDWAAQLYPDKQVLALNTPDDLDAIKKLWSSSLASTTKHTSSESSDSAKQEE